jgi:kynurenine formamidase
MKLYDATLAIHEKMVIFPGDPPFKKEPVSRIQTGEYEIFCLPLKIKGADGAPARILLRG